MGPDTESLPVGRQGTPTSTKKPAKTRQGRRGWPIRLRIAALLVVPLASLIVLWAFASNITLGPAIDKYDFSTTYKKIAMPGLFLMGQLQQERTLSAVAVRGAAGPQKRKLAEQRARSDAVQGAFRRTALSAEATDAAKPETRSRLAETIRRLDLLPGLRARVDSGRIETLEVISSYDEVLEGIIQVFNGLVIVNDLAIFEQGRALIRMGHARAFMLREDALIAAATASGGRLSPAERVTFAAWAANGRWEFQAAMADLSGGLRTPLQQFATSEGYQKYRAAESAVVGARDDRLPAESAAWPAITAPLSQAWEQRIGQASLALNELAKPIGERVVRRLVLAGGFGLLAVVASIVLSFMAARRLSRELRRLQRAALQLADERLPAVVSRLRRGEEVDVQAEAPPLAIGKTTEVIRVGDAFTKVQQTAIETAVRESYLRQGVSRVFLNMAWRSQSLLHRQLGMLDEMERRASDPDVLADLFRLDHLTTRMRRHAEGLVILSGSSAGRGWSRPVLIEDVLRAAVSEVEDYTRVEVFMASAEAALAGEVVADVVHLLAELIENATVFSPPPTEVMVRGEIVGNGFAVDIVDRGIGLDPAQFAALNTRLRHAPEFDLAVSDRLGLFVVARLAARHRIQVSLQPSVYGGVCAVVLMPRDLIVDLEQPADERAPAATNGPTNGPGRGDGSVDRSRPVPPVRRSNGAWTKGMGGVRSPAKGMLNAPIPADVPARPAAPVPRSFDDSVTAVAPGPFVPAANTDATPPASDPAPYEGGPVPFGAPVSFGQTADAAHGAPGPGPGQRAALPRRVRRASLAPQLRDEATAAVQPDDTLVAWERRSAAASRDLFAELQAGWLRGRNEDEGPSVHREERGPSS